MQKEMNALLADLAVESHKLQAFHWYVKGKDFFSAHMQLEKLYDEMTAQVDEIAEGMLQSGMKPIATLADFSANASVKEAGSTFISSEDAYAEAAKDYAKIVADARSLKEKAESDGHDVLVTKLETLVEAFSKTCWMLEQR